MIAVNGCGWPRRAKVTHPLHQEYARKTLYAYAPCQNLAGSEYLDRAIEVHFHGNWGAALKQFVTDPGNHWCPTWTKRNYHMENPPDNVADTAVALQERLKKPWLLQWPTSEEEDDHKKPHGDQPDVVKQELPDEAARKGTLAELLVKPVGPILVPSEDEEEDSRKKKLVCNDHKR